MSLLYWCCTGVGLTGGVRLSNGIAAASLRHNGMMNYANTSNTDQPFGITAYVLFLRLTYIILILFSGYY